MIMRSTPLLWVLALAWGLSGPLVAQDTVVETRLSRLEAQVAEIRDVLGLTGPETPNLPLVFAGSEHARWGLPDIDGTPLNKRFFVLDHDDGKKVASWVGYHLTRDNLAGDARRRDNFHPDPELSTGLRSELADYRRSGYDRGHMAPAAAFKRSDVAMSATFVLSNMAPQRPNLNRRIWAQLEGDVRSLAQTHGSIWVFTGPLYIDEDSTRIEPPDSIGPDRVAVPTHFFKVILCEHGPDDLQTFAFVMPNSLLRISGTPRDFLVSVDHVEQISGLDFFALVVDSLENRIERVTQTNWPIR